MALPGSDNFNRADAAIGSNWTNCLDTMYVRSNRAGGIDSTNHCAFWNVDSFNDDQYSQITVVDIGAYGGCWAAVRCATGGNFYSFRKNFFSGAAKLYKHISGTETELVDFGTVGATGDVFRIEIVGTTIKCLINGSQTGSDYASATELTTGAAGCGNGNDNLGSMCDDWSGGNMAGGGGGTEAARVGGSINGVINGRVA